MGQTALEKAVGEAQKGCILRSGGCSGIAATPLQVTPGRGQHLCVCLCSHIALAWEVSESRLTLQKNSAIHTPPWLLKELTSESQTSHEHLRLPQFLRARRTLPGRFFQIFCFLPEVQSSCQPPPPAPLLTVPGNASILTAQPRILDSIPQRPGP